MSATTNQAQAVLAINFNHDGAAAVVVDGELCGFVETERYSRLKKHPGIREEDLDEVLDQANVSLRDLAVVVLCNLNTFDSRDILTVHGTTLKETWLHFALDRDHNAVTMRGRKIPCILNPEHHLLHAACTYFSSDLDSALVLTIDPLGCTAFVGRGEVLEKVELGLDRWFDANALYNTVSADMFGTGLIGAGKVMALAPYSCTKDFADDPDFRSAFPADQPTAVRRLAKYAERYRQDMEVEGRILNIGLAGLVQARLEQQMEALFERLGQKLRHLGVEANIALSGGTALNIAATERAFRRSPFREMHFHPACGDDGTAIGAAWLAWNQRIGRETRPYAKSASLCYGVRKYSADDVEGAMTSLGGVLTTWRGDGYIGLAAQLLAQGRVLGWYQGGSEVGPRALGHRSILADPRDPGMRDRLNRIKGRDWYRPVAPVVMDTEASKWFDCSRSPYMLRQAMVRRSGISAVTHVDRSARLQTVSSESCPELAELLSRFGSITGVPVLANTSLNVDGEPIVETPLDACRTFIASGVDHLVFPGVIVSGMGSESLSVLE